MANLDAKELNKEGELIKGASKEFLKCSNQIYIDKFFYAPMGYRVLFPTCVVLLIVSYILAFFMPFVSILMQILVLTAILSEYILNWRISDYFFKEQMSCNFEAVVTPTGEVKRRVILSCDVDNSEFGINKILGKLGSKIISAVNLIGVIYIIVFTVISLVNNGFGIRLPNKLSAIIGIIGVIFIPLILTKTISIFLTATDDGGTVEKVNNIAPIIENLFRDKLANTEVSLLVAGGKKAGIRGQKAYVENNKVKLANSQNIFIDIENIFYAGNIKISYTKNKSVAEKISNEINNDNIKCQVKKSVLNNSHILEFAKFSNNVFSLYKTEVDSKEKSLEVNQGLENFIRKFDTED